MRNGWTAPAGQDFIATASKPAHDRAISDDETGLVSQSVISSNIRELVRLTTDLYHASGFIFPYKKTEANLIPLANNVRSVRKNVRAHPVLCFARPRAIAILFKDGESARQIAIGAKRIEVLFVPNLSSQIGIGRHQVIWQLGQSP